MQAEVPAVAVQAVVTAVAVRIQAVVPAAWVADLNSDLYPLVILSFIPDHL